MNKTRGTYERVEQEYTLSIDYTYYWERGDYDSLPDAELDVTEVYIKSKSMPFTLIPLEFYYDFLHEQMEELVCEYAQDHA